MTQVVYALDPIANPGGPLGSSGSANYEHAGAAQSVDPDVWTVLLNDASGPLTTEEFLPPGVATYYDEASAKILPRGPLGATLGIRLDVELTPSVNNAALDFRLVWRARDAPGGMELFSFPLQQGQPRLDEGAGIPYLFVETFIITLDGQPQIDGDIQLEILCSASVSVDVNGWKIIRF